MGKPPRSSPCDIGRLIKTQFAKLLNTLLSCYASIEGVVTHQ